ncbi:hypothetical protein NF867_16715 [Solitalea sp. MAHUQ-68]|uniref:Uncharacterized protein n=1 Tax=Solitalea agri TaxID=2953739 RepID=A0A9X2F4C9_9SPHI|nr:hypothetical protein [Solitalea agri]MCO4294507.1 hypothetical protein [Solitalea agri]
MTPSNKDAKKTSKKILEANIALKIKEALKDIEHGDSKKVAKTIQEASKKLARRILKASQEVDRELKKRVVTKPVATPPKVSKTRATKVVARVKKVVAKVEGTASNALEKPLITSAALPPVKQLKVTSPKTNTRGARINSKSAKAPQKNAPKVAGKPRRSNTEGDEELGHS